MGSLAVNYCTISRPFTVSGVDFTGLFLCRLMLTLSKIRFKVYVAVFICFSTRAIHLQLVSSLTTEAFLSSLHHFVARRSLPLVICYNNDANFKGKNNYLNLNDIRVQNYCLTEAIEWCFNPPRVPHCHGLWEKP